MLAMESDVHGELFNIGTGTNYSVRELADMISDNQVMIEPRIGEARITLANNSKAREMLGWYPEHNIADYVKENI